MCVSSIHHMYARNSNVRTIKDNPDLMITAAEYIGVRLSDKAPFNIKENSVHVIISRIVRYNKRQCDYMYPLRPPTTLN